MIQLTEVERRAMIQHSQEENHKGNNFEII